MLRVETASHESALEIIGIGNRRNGLDARTWQLFIDSVPAGPGHSVDPYVPSPGERVELRFEKSAGAQKVR